jgi:hypothetical protein
MPLPMIESYLMEASPRVDRDRLSIVLGAAALGFTLSKVVQLPTPRLGAEVLGSQLGVQLTSEWLMVAFAIGLVSAGVHGLLQLHPCLPGRHVRHTYVFWILPGLTALASGVLLTRVEEVPVWVPAMGAAIILLGLVISSEFAALGRTEDEWPTAQLLTTVVVYLLAGTLFTLIYGTRARTLLMAPAVFGVSTLLAMRHCWRPSEGLARVALHGCAVGLVMSQAVWALNYWKITALAGAALLLLIFYVAAGVARQSLQGKTDSRALLEYGVVGLIAAGLALVLGI